MWSQRQQGKLVAEDKHYPWFLVSFYFVITTSLFSVTVAKAFTSACHVVIP